MASRWLIFVQNNLQQFCAVYAAARCDSECHFVSVYKWWMFSLLSVEQIASILWTHVTRPRGTGRVCFCLQCLRGFAARDTWMSRRPRRTRSVWWGPSGSTSVPSSQCLATRRPPGPDRTPSAIMLPHDKRDEVPARYWRTPANLSNENWQQHGAHQLAQTIQ